MWWLEPSCAYRPKQQRIPPPKGAVRDERYRAEGIAVPVFHHAGDDLSQPAVTEGQRNDDASGLRREQSSIHATQYDRCQAEAREPQRTRIRYLSLRH